MEKFDNRKQAREVSEFMDALLLPLRTFLKKEEKELLEKALRIIRNCEVEETNETRKF